MFKTPRSSLDVSKPSFARTTIAVGERPSWDAAASTEMHPSRVESAAGWGAPKKITRMVTEGSVLVSAQPPRGSVRDVAPDGFEHPVFRAGFAVAIPLPGGGA